VLRTATPSALRQLVDSATRNDRDLDTALIDLGVLPPVDLEQVRACLQLAHTEIAAGVNADGHRVITLIDGDHPVASIHQDGRVTRPV
jgi:hypothetical protein